MVRLFAEASIVKGKGRRCAVTVALVLGVALGLPAWDALAASGDTTADRELGQPDFATTTQSFGGATGLRLPSFVAVDPASGRIYVSDTQNNRILSWPSAATFTNGQGADRVIGQTDFTSIAINGGLPSPQLGASTLYRPSGLAVDSGGNLYVADYGNNRVLKYQAPTSTGMSASAVLGQPDFSSRLPNDSGLNASSLNLPIAVAVDAGGNIYVVDQANHRVLEYDSGAVNAAANRVFGQPDTASAGCNNGGRSASSLCLPTAVAVDSAGNLYVADGPNNRVLQYNNPLGTDAIADRVYGQVDFTGQIPNLFATASNLRNPQGVAIDAAGNLYVSDTGFNRVVAYRDTPAGDTVADFVFGQGGSFTMAVPNNGGVSADSVSNVAGLAADSAGSLYVVDRNNNRVLGFDQPISGPPSGDSFTGASATGTGNITATFTGGGAAARSAIRNSSARRRVRRRCRRHCPHPA